MAILVVSENEFVRPRETHPLSKAIIRSILRLTYAWQTVRDRM